MSDLKYVDRKAMGLANSCRLVKFLSERRAFSVKHCGDFLLFDVYRNLNDPDLTKRILSGGMFCHYRFCILCSYRKCRKLQHEILSAINHFEQDPACRFSYLFLTLTVPNCAMADLREVASRMSYAFSKMTKVKIWRLAVKGYVRSIEVIGDHTENGMAHPHFHVLLAVDSSYFHSAEYISFAQWRALWSNAYGVDNLIVRIEKIRTKYLPNGEKLPAKIAAVSECLKYSMDLTDLKKLSSDDLKHLMEQSRGIKQCNRGGIFQNIFNDPVDLCEWELVTQEGFRWLNNKYCPLNTDEACE